MDAIVCGLPIGSAEKAVFVNSAGKLSIGFRDAKHVDFFAEFLQTIIHATIIFYLQKNISNRSWVATSLLPVYLGTFIPSGRVDPFGHHYDSDAIFLDENKKKGLANLLKDVSESGSHGKFLFLKSLGKYIYISIPYKSRFSTVNEIIISFHESKSNAVCDLMLANMLQGVLAGKAREE